jgi:tRNA A37 threonylcarbamoyladenosine modification protein TsaB
MNASCSLKALFEEQAISFYWGSQEGFLALSHRGKIITEKHSWKKSPSAEALPFLQDVVQKYDFSLLKTDIILAPKGPDSFTNTRITTVLAQSLKFCQPQATAFSPTTFHLLAFVASPFLEQGENLCVLVDSFKCGFYGAVFSFEQDSGLVLNSPPIFFDQNLGLDFLRSYQSCAVIHNFSQNSVNNHFLPHIHGRIFTPQENLALAQIKLYNECVVRSLFRDASHDFTHFLPFYLDATAYKKLPLFSPSL